MSVSSPLTRGRNVKAKYRQNGVPLIVVFNSVIIEEIADEEEDDAIGEVTARFDIVADGYKVLLVGYLPDFFQLDTWLADTANEDAGLPPTTKTIQFTIAQRDGTTRVFTCHGANGSRGAWNIKTERRTYQLGAYSFRCTKVSSTNA